MKPVQPPFPKSYDANARCEYHGGGVGHSTERCLALKHKVQNLIDAGWLTFEEVDGSKDGPKASSSTMNAIKERRTDQGVRCLEKVKMSRMFI